MFIHLRPVATVVDSMDGESSVPAPRVAGGACAVHLLFRVYRAGTAPAVLRRGTMKEYK